MVINELRRHYIGVGISREELEGRVYPDIKLSDLWRLQGKPWGFNWNEAHIIAVEHDWLRDVLWIYIANKYLPYKIESMECERYLYYIAERRFPWLFADTNPLLYKKF